VIKVLFDENFGKPMISPLAALLSKSPFPPVAIRHILDFYSQGTPDSAWIPQIAAEGWILISADRGRRCGGPKLPLLCRQYHVTHVLLSGTIHSQSQYNKIVSVAAVWEDIVAAGEARKGSQYILKLSGTKKSYPVLVFRETL